MNILDLLLPKRCVGCGKVGRYFCPSCTSKVKLIKPNEAICPVCERLAVDGRTHPGCQTRYALDGLTSFFRYDGPIRSAVKQLKYRRVSSLASEFIDLIPSSSLSNLYSLTSKLSFLIPIPLHWSRHRERGFNQAEVVGRMIAVRLDLVMRTDILRRTRKTTPQVEMKDRKERLGNMVGAFCVRQDFDTIPLHANGKRQNMGVILVDDVFTTGATMRAAANVLKRVGVKSVWGLTMAR